MKQFVPYLVQLYHPGMHKADVHTLAFQFIAFLIPEVSAVIDPSEFEEFKQYGEVEPSHKEKHDHHGHQKHGRRLHKVSHYDFEDGDDFDSDLDYDFDKHGDDDDMDGYDADDEDDYDFDNEDGADSEDQHVVDAYYFQTAAQIYEGCLKHQDDSWF